MELHQETCQKIRKWFGNLIGDSEIRAEEGIFSNDDYLIDYQEIPYEYELERAVVKILTHHGLKPSIYLRVYPEHLCYFVYDQNKIIQTTMSLKNRVVLSPVQFVKKEHFLFNNI